MNPLTANELMQADGMSLLRIAQQTGLVLTASGRIARANDPDRSPGPLLGLFGCAQGNLVRIRHDVSDRLARDLLEIAGTEPPWTDADREPSCLGLLLACLSSELPVKKVVLEVAHRIPNALAREHGAKLVQSDSAEGVELAARFANSNMPRNMVDAGFKRVADLWGPWCIAREGDAVASIAFAARLGENGAAIGVYTFPGFRGRGLAAAVTSGWSAHPALARRVLFYSASRDNQSSRRVIERLQLPRIGASLLVE